MGRGLPGLLAGCWVTLLGVGAAGAGEVQPAQSRPGGAFQMSGGEAVEGLRLQLDYRPRRSPSSPAVIRFRLINQTGRPIRLFLGGDPFGAVPFALMVDGKEPTGVVAAHRHDGKTVTRVLRPHRDYVFDLGPAGQFLGHLLMATYQVGAADCLDCWTGRLLSPGLWLPAPDARDP